MPTAGRLYLLHTPPGIATFTEYSVFRTLPEITFVFCFSGEVGCSGGRLTALSTLTSIVLFRLSSVLSQAELNAPLALQQAASWRSLETLWWSALSVPPSPCPLPEAARTAFCLSPALQSSQSTASIITAHVLLLGAPTACEILRRQGNRGPGLKALHFDRKRKREGRLRGKGGRRNAACTIYKHKFGSNYLLGLMLNSTFRNFIFNHCNKCQLFESSCLRGCRTG